MVAAPIRSITHITKPKQPRRMARPPIEAVSINAKPAVAAASGPFHAAAKRPCKQDLVLDFMRRDRGASLAKIVEATGWLLHTTRAALTGLRKKGHVIDKSKVNDETRYSVSTVAGQ